MSILIIRHGETASNVERVVQTPQTPLNERGLRQARRLARRLGDWRLGGILSSDLERARMTAAALTGSGLEIELEPLLQERNFGALRGRTYEEIGLDIFAPGYAPPEGETWEVFHERVERAWERVVARARDCSGVLAVVTHGLVCRSLAERTLQLPERTLAPERWGNTSLTVVEPEAPWRVVTLNCTEHLCGDAADDEQAAM